jgi:hypothetical protein
MEGYGGGGGYPNDEIHSLIAACLVLKERYEGALG